MPLTGTKSTINITFWDELDYIGIQAYFPLVDKDSPSVKEVKAGWDKYLPALKALSERHGKQILFTEIGYKSSTDAAKEPWLWVENEEEGAFNLSLETQANCYEAFFETVWKEDWFAGVHFWQYNTGYVGRESMIRNVDFTPQGKPAEKVIAKYFGQKWKLECVSLALHPNQGV